MMHRALPAVRDEATPYEKLRVMELIGCIQLL